MQEDSRPIFIAMGHDGTIIEVEISAPVVAVVSASIPVGERDLFAEEEEGDMGADVSVHMLESLILDPSLALQQSAVRGVEIEDSIFKRNGPEPLVVEGS